MERLKTNRPERSPQQWLLRECLRFQNISGFWRFRIRTFSHSIAAMRASSSITRLCCLFLPPPTLIHAASENFSGGGSGGHRRPVDAIIGKSKHLSRLLLIMIKRQFSFTDAGTRVPQDGMARKQALTISRNIRLHWLCRSLVKPAGDSQEPRESNNGA